MTTTALIYRMVLRVMAGEPPGELYDEYIKARRLHVTVAAELIATVHEHLVQANICYLFRTDEWTKKGRYIYGKAYKVPEQWRYLSGYDLLVVINRSVWTTLTPEQRTALVDHELSHFDRVDDAHGNLKNWAIVDHDVEEFIGVVRRHGIWQEGLQELVKAGRQMQIFDGLKVVVK